MLDCETPTQAGVKHVMVTLGTPNVPIMASIRSQASGATVSGDVGSQSSSYDDVADAALPNRADEHEQVEQSARTSASGAGQQTDIAEPESIEAEGAAIIPTRSTRQQEYTQIVHHDESDNDMQLEGDNILGVDHGDRDIETMTAADLVACLDLFMQEQAAEIMLQGKRSCCRINHDLYLSEEYFCPDSFHEVKQVLADCYGVAAADVKAPKHRNYAVLLDDLQGKVVWVDASATSLQAPAGVVLARRQLSRDAPSFTLAMQAFTCVDLQLKPTGQLASLPELKRSITKISTSGNICKEVNQKWQAKSDSICVLDDDDGSCGNKDMMFYVTAILSEARLNASLQKFYWLQHQASLS
ncbi:hypothetical protein WJX79_010619 [Trebouxia sp. C0005]